MASPLVRELRSLLEQQSSAQRDTMHRVFVFETLMNQPLRKKLLKRDVEFEVDSIPNWKEINTDSKAGEDYHTLIPSEGDEVKGHVLFVTDEEMAILDDWEDQYEKKKVMLASGGVAFVYLLKKEYMQDYGGNTFYELSDDDLDIISRELDSEE